MKKIAINLSAIERINAVPLRQALELHTKAVAELALHREKFQALKEEVEKFLADTAPDDGKRLALISGKKLQLDMYPAFITRSERQIADVLIPAIARHGDEFRTHLIRFYEAAHETAATQLADLFRPYFEKVVFHVGDQRDRAREVALQTDLCWDIFARKEEAERLRNSNADRRANPEAYDNNLREFAASLLALAERN